MGLNDESEKLRQADKWLATEPIKSENYQAAMEFLHATDVNGYTYVVVPDLWDTSPAARKLAVDKCRQTLVTQLADANLIPITSLRVDVELKPEYEFGPEMIHVTAFVPVRKPA